MIRIQLDIELNYEIDPLGADFVFNIHAAHTASQYIHAESLWLSQDLLPDIHADPMSGNRYMRMRAMPGALKLQYSATVDLIHHLADPSVIPEVPVRLLPRGDGLHLPQPLLPVGPAAQAGEPAVRPPVARLQSGAGHPGLGAVTGDVHLNSSNSNASAVDTLIERVGICRDFAHLMIALCRALNIPARFVTGTDYGADPVLGPPDFHAYVEVYLGNRWYIFDPSGTAMPMGLVRFGTGRDAADVAFATIFGGVQSHAPIIHAWAVEDAAQGAVLPHHSTSALSTDDGRQTLHF